MASVPQQLRDTILSDENIKLVYSALSNYIRANHDLDVGDHLLEHSRDLLLSTFAHEIDVQDPKNINTRQFVKDVDTFTLNTLIEQFKSGHLDKFIGKDLRIRSYEDEIRERGYDLLPPRRPQPPSQETQSDKSIVMAPIEDNMYRQAEVEVNNSYGPPSTALIKTSDRNYFENKLANPLFATIPPGHDIFKIVIGERHSFKMSPYLLCETIQQGVKTLYRLQLTNSVEGFLFYGEVALLEREPTDSTINQIQLLNIFLAPPTIKFGEGDNTVIYGAEIAMSRDRIIDVSGGKKKDEHTVITYSDGGASLPQNLTLYEFLQTQQDITVEYQKRKRNVIKKTVDILEITPEFIMVERVDGLTLDNIISITNKEIGYAPTFASASIRGGVHFTIENDTEIFYETRAQ